MSVAIPFESFYRITTENRYTQALHLVPKYFRAFFVQLFGQKPWHAFNQGHGNTHFRYPVGSLKAKQPAADNNCFFCIKKTLVYCSNTIHGPDGMDSREILPFKRRHDWCASGGKNQAVITVLLA